MTNQKPQDPKLDMIADDESVEDDLAILNNMNIDEDFNIWEDFRASVAVKKQRESIESVFSRSSISNRQIGDSISSSNKDLSSIDIGDSSRSTSAVVMGLYNNKKDKFEASEFSIAEIDVDIDTSDRSGDKQVSSHTAAEEKNKATDGGGALSTVNEKKDASPSLDVSFSTLTAGERQDIRSWNTRLHRDTVFSRYYFPEQWELRELKTIEKFLELDSKNTSWLDEPGKETTKRTVGDIFFPGDHDAKSVLLKRGPILFDGVDEREMLLFTHGFLLSRMEFDSLLNLLFTINSKNPEALNPKQLRDRFDAIDTDKSGSLDRCELKEVFKGMGVPISERALSDLMVRFDKDEDGTIEYDEFCTVMNELTPKKEPEKWGWNSLKSSAVGMLKKSVAQAPPKLDCAYPLSDIEKVESINLCCSESTQFFQQSSWAELVFAIFLKGRGEPLIMVCSKPEHRLAWVDAFRICYVNSLHLRADNGSRIAKRIRSKVGWQHRVIMASLFSLVLCKNIEVLKEQLDKDSPDINIDESDEYNGYTALHYAVVIDDVAKARLLMEHGAQVNVQDNNGKTPLDHAELSGNPEMIELLETHGGKKNTSEPLFKAAIEEQKRIKEAKPTQKTVAKAKGAASAMAQGMSALKERGERLEKLDNRTAELGNEAANFADMAKQLKEQTKKKSSWM